MRIGRTDGVGEEPLSLRSSASSSAARRPLATARQRREPAAPTAREPNPPTGHDLPGHDRWRRRRRRGGGPVAPPDALWYVYYNPAAECYATGWEYPGGEPGYPGWVVLTRPAFGVVMTLLTWIGTGTFTWEDFDPNGDGTWDGARPPLPPTHSSAAFDLDPCAAPPNDTPWVLHFIAALDFTAGAVETAPPGDPWWGAGVRDLAPDYAALEAAGGVS